MDPQALQRVESLFHEQISQGVHPGAGLAVYRHGNLVLDLYGGASDARSGNPVTADTMFVLYSCTKPLTAACLHLLWERGRVAWDDRVAEYWPGFGRNGKDTVTVRQVLTHTAGFPDTPAELSWDRWHDWDFVVETMEDLTPLYQPGKIIAYHPRNFGWIIGELVRRIDGRPIAQFLREEITDPLGMADTYLGLPVSLEHRVSRVHAMDDCDRPSMPSTYNKPGVHQAVQPAGGGIAAARDLARFYAMMVAGGALDGTRILETDTVAEVTGSASGRDGPHRRAARPAFPGPFLGRQAHGGPGPTDRQFLRPCRRRHLHRLGRPRPGPGRGLHHQRLPGRELQHREAFHHLPGGARRLPVRAFSIL